MEFKEIDFKKINCFILNPDPNKLYLIYSALNLYNACEYFEEKFNVIGASTSEFETYEKIQKFENKTNEIIAILFYDIERFINIDNTNFTNPKSLIDKGALGDFSKIKMKYRREDRFELSDTDELQYFKNDPSEFPSIRLKEVNRERSLVSEFFQDRKNEAELEGEGFIIDELPTIFNRDLLGFID